MAITGSDPWGEIATALVPVLILLRLELLERRAIAERSRLMTATKEKEVALIAPATLKIEPPHNGA